MIGNGLIVVGGMEYPAADVTSSAGAVVAVYQRQPTRQRGLHASIRAERSRRHQPSAHGDHDDDHTRRQRGQHLPAPMAPTAGASSQDQTFTNGVLGAFVQETGIVQVDDDYAILASDAWIIVTDGSHTATLPDATVSAGRQYMITNGHENTGETVTVDKPEARRSTDRAAPL